MLICQSRAKLKDIKMFVYQITNLVNGKNYIGITNNLYKRWNEHKRVREEGQKEYDKPLYKAFRKYGIDNFEFKELFNSLELEEAEEKEIELIKELDTLSHDQGYNITTGGRYGSKAVGERNRNATLTKAQATDIITRRENGESFKSVFKDYNHLLKTTGMNSIWLGVSWKHLQPEIAYKTHANRSLSDNQVREIRSLLEEGTMTQRAIAKQFNVTPTSICEIKSGKRYSDIH